LDEPLKIRLELDEMWGRVYYKGTPGWLWHAINHENGDLVAFILGSREHDMLWELMCELATANIEITAVYTDNNPAYREIISAVFPGVLEIGKRNTQKIGRKHLTFRTRLKRLTRKTICYSKELEMHKIMVSMLINHLEFAVQLY
jgi:IS1 family transposase